MKRIDFYFDFVSPFSYIASHRLGEIPAAITCKPVLFAGLLKHWGHIGPAEIPSKRRWTYRWCQWWAAELGIAFRFPAAHPFNPLAHLRLALACGSRPEAIERIFASIWTSGEDANDPARFAALCRELAVEEAKLAETKDELRKNTEEAAARGVFGVPSFVVDGEVFWGVDATDFVLQYLENPKLLHDPEFKRVSTLPAGAERKR
jgi:2-hydroxychromene-2-carboxylate isomerase